MATKFFIGGNKFYDSEEEANTELAGFAAEFGIPIEIFSIVKIHKEGPQDTFKPAETVH
jgi:hypothetical protein